LYHPPCPIPETLGERCRRPGCVQGARPPISVSPHRAHFIISWCRLDVLCRDRLPPPSSVAIPGQTRQCRSRNCARDALMAHLRLHSEQSQPGSPSPPSPAAIQPYCDSLGTPSQPNPTAVFLVAPPFFAVYCCVLCSRASASTKPALSTQSHGHSPVSLISTEGPNGTR
jgi:hypothetical protein